MYYSILEIHSTYRLNCLNFIQSKILNAFVAKVTSRQEWVYNEEIPFLKSTG